MQKKKKKKKMQNSVIEIHKIFKTLARDVTKLSKETKRQNKSKMTRVQL